MIPGEYFVAPGDVECNVGRRTATLTATNTGDRPVQVGSHFHFFEVNREMSFDRALAFGMHLNIAAGTAVRFEPGEEKEIELVEYGGRSAFLASTTWWMATLRGQAAARPASSGPTSSISTTPRNRLTSHEPENQPR